MVPEKEIPYCKIWCWVVVFLITRVRVAESAHKLILLPRAEFGFATRGAWRMAGQNIETSGLGNICRRCLYEGAVEQPGEHHDVFIRDARGKECI